MAKWKVAVGLACLCLCSFAVAQLQTVRPVADRQELAVPQPMVVEGTGDQPTYVEDLTASVWDRAAAYPVAGPAQHEGRELATFPAEAEKDGGLRVGSDNNCDANVPAVACGGSTVVTFLTPLTEIAGAEYPSCNGGYMVCNNVWRKFQATGTDAIIDACISTATTPDSIIAVYRCPNQSNLCSGRVEIGCSDDVAGCAANGLGARVQVSGLVVNQWYLFQIGVRRYGTETATTGNYTVAVQCFSGCTVTCPPGAKSEWEINPCGDPNTTHINDGCNAAIPTFTRITANSTFCGTSQYDGTIRDTDWYQIVMNDPNYAGTYSLTWRVNAEFNASMIILGALDANQPISCTNFTTLANNDPNTYVPCQANQQIQLAAAAKGTYWLFVAPGFNSGTVACGKKYVAQAIVSPALEARGACCVATVCSIKTADNCRTSGGFYFGDGSACTDKALTCYSCTGQVEKGAIVSPTGETLCPTDPNIVTYTDSYNAGCGFSTTTPPLGFYTFTTTPQTITICGTSGTYIQSAGGNVRDNDYFAFILPGTGGDPNNLGTISLVTASLLAEFPNELILTDYNWVYDSGSGSFIPDNPCVTFSPFDLWSFGTAGHPNTTANCYYKHSFAQDYGDVWVIVRPDRRGSPLDYPCGMRYKLDVSVAACTGTGACCSAQGCSIVTFIECFNLGGDFYGPGSACADICCPCAPTNTQELPDDCTAPDNVNSGCVVFTGGPPAPGRTMPIAAGEHICGKTGMVSADGFPGSTFEDYDMYRYTATGANDIAIHCFAEFAPTLVYYPWTAGDPANCTGWAFGNMTFFDDGTPCTETVRLVQGVTVGQTYHLGVMNYRDNQGSEMSCTDPNNDDRGRYEFWIEVLAPSGACCLPPQARDPNHPWCQRLSQADCTAAGGLYQGDGTACLPTNPCCEITCDPNDPSYENEADCGLPNDTTNTGCNGDPNDPSYPLFGQQLTGTAPYDVCGSVASAGDTRDTDWFIYNHTGGTLWWFAASEFSGAFFILFEPLDPNDPCTYQFQYSQTLLADCGGASLVNVTDPNDTPAGDYIVVVVPDFQPAFACPGADYYVALSSGDAIGACCLEDDVCIDWPNEDICVNWFGGTFQGVGTDCDPNPCGGTEICRGDCNCDGAVGFADIDLFVAAIPNNQANWAAKYQLFYGNPPPAGCWENTNVNGTGTHAGFDDIDPFVKLIPTPCTPRACCFPGGSCVDLVPGDCLIAGGTFSKISANLCAQTTCP